MVELYLYLMRVFNQYELHVTDLLSFHNLAELL